MNSEPTKPRYKLRDIWDKKELYKGIKQRDHAVMRYLSWHEWLARTSFIDYTFVGRLLRDYLGL